MQSTVASILREKGDWVITIDPYVTVFRTIGRMVEHNVGAIVVTEDGAVRGVFTERDYLRRIALKGRSSKTTRVEEVMSEHVLTVTPEATIEACMKQMTEHKCRHLPVMRDGRLCGLISIGDCVRRLSQAASDRAQHMERFVAGTYPG